MFGTKMADEFFGVHTGGDVAFVNGVLKVLLAEGGDRPRVRPRPHRRLRRVAAPSSKRESFDDLERQSGTTRADMERFARMYAGRAERGAGVVDGHHAARHGTDDVAAIVNLGLARGNVGRRAPGSCRSAATRACRAAPRWARTRPRSPAASRSTPESAAALAEHVRLPRRATRRASPPRRWSRPAARRDRRPVLDGRQLPRRAARSRVRRRRAGAGPAARAPGHRGVEPDARRSRRGGGAAARRDPLRAARRRHRDHHRAAHRLQPRDPGPAHRRGAQRVGDLRRPRSSRRSRARATSCRSRRARRSATRSPRRPARTRASSRSRRPATRCSGVAHGSATAGTSRRPTARRTSPRSRPAERSAPEGAFVLSTRRGQAVQLDGLRATRSAHRRDARRVVHGCRRRRRLGVADGAPVIVRSEHGELRARVHLGPIRPGNVQVFFPEGNVLLPVGDRDPESGVPDYNAVVTDRARAVTARRGCSRCSTATARPRSGPRSLPLSLGSSAGAAHRSHAASTRSTLVADAAALPCSTRAGLHVVSEESGWTGPDDAADHRRDRPGRRLQELRPQHPVLGDLAVRARRVGDRSSATW